MSIKSQEELLKQLANELDGAFVEGHYGNSDTIEVNFNGYKIIFDPYFSYTVISGLAMSQGFTRVRVRFNQKDNFNFIIHRKGFFSAVRKLFGAHDILIGDDEFDKSFTIKSNNENRIRLLLSNNSIKEIISSQDNIRLEIFDKIGPFSENVPDGISELYFIHDGSITDIEKLKSLKTLFIEILTDLSKLSDITPDNSNVSYY
jgi:hypothetical protein